MKLGSIFPQRVLKKPDSLKNKAYAFGKFRFDAESRLLLEDGRSAPLPPKALALLALLIQNPGRLVETEILKKDLWPGVFVEDGNLTQHISTLRKVLGDDAIETVPRRGYRFIAAVTEDPDRGRRSRRWWVGAAALSGVSLAFAGRQFF